MTDLEQAQVFGANAWEKAGRGQELTKAEGMAVLRTLGARGTFCRRRPVRPAVAAASRDSVAA
jgi:hypothetical protein